MPTTIRGALERSEWGYRVRQPHAGNFVKVRSCIGGYPLWDAPRQNLPPSVTGFRIAAGSRIRVSSARSRCRIIGHLPMPPTSGRSWKAPWRDDSQVVHRLNLYASRRCGLRHRARRYRDDHVVLAAAARNRSQHLALEKRPRDCPLTSALMPTAGRAQPARRSTSENCQTLAGLSHRSPDRWMGHDGLIMIEGTGVRRSLPS